jgi:hypothetical protein
MSEIKSSTWSFFVIVYRIVLTIVAFVLCILAIGHYSVLYEQVDLLMSKIIQINNECVHKQDENVVFSFIQMYPGQTAFNLFICVLFWILIINKVYSLEISNEKLIKQNKESNDELTRQVKESNIYSIRYSEEKIVLLCKKMEILINEHTETVYELKKEIIKAIENPYGAD